MIDSGSNSYPRPVTTKLTFFKEAIWKQYFLYCIFRSFIHQMALQSNTSRTSDAKSPFDRPSHCFWLYSKRTQTFKKVGQRNANTLFGYRKSEAPFHRGAKISMSCSISFLRIFLLFRFLLLTFFSSKDRNIFRTVCFAFSFLRKCVKELMTEH